MGFFKFFIWLPLKHAWPLEIKKFLSDRFLEYTKYTKALVNLTSSEINHIFCLLELTQESCRMLRMCLALDKKTKK